MSASLAILTIGIVPMQEVLPLLTEYIDEDNISHHSLLGLTATPFRLGKGWIYQFHYHGMV
nr:hypothetical protein [Escherichia coli]